MSDVGIYLSEVRGDYSYSYAKQKKKPLSCAEPGVAGCCEVFRLVPVGLGKE